MLGEHQQCAVDYGNTEGAEGKLERNNTVLKPRTFKRAGHYKEYAILGENRNSLRRTIRLNSEMMSDGVEV